MTAPDLPAPPPAPDAPVGPDGTPLPQGPAPGVDPCLHLDDATRRDALQRLKSVRGHLDGVVRMLEDDAVYCVDVLKQLKALQGGLAATSGKVLRAHVRDHVATAAQRGDTDAIVDELLDALKYGG